MSNVGKNQARRTPLPACGAFYHEPLCPTCTDNYQGKMLSALEEQTYFLEKIASVREFSNESKRPREWPTSSYIPPKTQASPEIKMRSL